MRGPFFPDNHIFGQHSEVALGRFLQDGLEVVPQSQRAPQNLPHLLQYKCLGSRIAAIQVDGPQNRLKGIRQQIVTATALGLLTTAELDLITQMQIASLLCELLGADELRLHLGQATLGFTGVLMVEKIAHNQPQHCIAEKLQALVGKARVPNLVGIGLVA